MCLGVSGRKGGKIRRIFEKSSEKLVPVFRSCNPRVKIFGDVSQGSKGVVHSLWSECGVRSVRVLR